MQNTELTQPTGSKLKALIGPHAGYAYSGPTAAWAYRNLAQSASEFDRVVLLGPSHKVYLDFLATTAASAWATPLGNLTVDEQTIDDLAAQADSTNGSLAIQRI